MTRIKKVYKETEVALRKSQKKIRKYTNRKRREAEEYRVEDWVLLSIKDLKYQIQRRRLEKLTEKFIRPY